MKQVWKYETKIADNFVIEMPQGSQVLCFQLQRETPCIWALVNPEEEKKSTYTFRLCGTGHPLDEQNLIYIGTVVMMDGGLVLHLFLMGVDL